MATFKLRENVLSGQTGLSVRLYALPGSSIVNGAGGDTLTETASSDGEFTATVAESLSGLHAYAVYKSGNAIASGQVYCGTSPWVADDLTTLISDQTDLIGTGSATVSAPVSETGTITEIIIGDDYLDANDRAFEWTVDAPTGFVLADCSCHFGGSAGNKGSWNVEGTITDAGSGNWLLSFDLPKASTESCAKGNYEWSVAVHDSVGVEITRVRSSSTKVQLVEKYT